MTCISCKRELPDDAVYCLYCGKKQRSEEKKHIRHRGNGQGSVYKDSKGHYTAEKTFGYYMESGKRKRIFKRKKGFTTKKLRLSILQLSRRRPRTEKLLPSRSSGRPLSSTSAAICQNQSRLRTE